MTLTGFSLVSEWLEHPTGGPVLRDALQQAIGTSELPFGPDSMIGRMALASPLMKFVNFIPGMDARTVDQLVAAAAASPAPR
jgi:beta-glucosidase